jgi:hypothetical protein
VNRLPMSTAAAGLIRALAARAGAPRDRILLTQVHSTDWQSLTFVGERHHLCLRVSGADAAAATERMCKGLEDAEFDIPGQIVADIHVTERSADSDGSVSMTIEALTVGD